MPYGNSRCNGISSIINCKARLDNVKNKSNTIVPMPNAIIIRKNIIDQTGGAGKVVAAYGYTM